MANPECKSCRMRGVCRDSKTSWMFFFIGVIATIALRIIEPVRAVNPFYAKISWYVGVTGFFLFFVYKYLELNKRSKIIRETGLKEKLASSAKLSDDEYMLLSEIVCSQGNWKERANFLVIFTLSAVALALALWIDLIA
jgi:uncharacterized membrane protein